MMPRPGQIWTDNKTSNAVKIIFITFGDPRTVTYLYTDKILSVKNTITAERSDFLKRFSYSENLTNINDIIT